MIGPFFAKLGWTRDDAKWGRLQALSLAALIASGGLDLQYWAHYLGIPLSETAQHWLVVIAAITLWIAGKNDTSDLPGKTGAGSVAPRNYPPAAVVFLAVALGAGAFTMTGCASLGGARHVATVSVVSVHGVLSVVQDTERALVCGGATAPAPPSCVPPDVHRTIAGYFVTAFDLDGQVARLVRATPPDGVTPGDVPGLLARITDLLDHVFKALPNSPQKSQLIAQVAEGSR